MQPVATPVTCMRCIYSLDADIIERVDLRATLQVGGNPEQREEILVDLRGSWFAVADMVSGFHQCALDEESKQFTAFICYLGLYEWCRCPMGIKGAPSYFQQQMALAFSGLLYTCLELYIDDVIVFGRDFKHYMYNLRRFFARVREKNLALSPKKCRFGLREVEYVGHVISEKGKYFTQEKMHKIRNFPRPVMNKQLKSFLGLANYFREHVL